MSRDTTVIPLRQPEAIDDPLSEIAREGARRPDRASRPAREPNFYADSETIE